MRFFSTLRSRLLLTFFGLLLLGFSGLTLLAGQQIAENIYNNGLKSLENSSLQLSSLLHEVIEESAHEAEDNTMLATNIKFILHENGFTSGATVLDEQKEVLFDNQKPLSGLDAKDREDIMEHLISKSESGLNVNASVKEPNELGFMTFYAVARIYDEGTTGYVYLVQPAEKSQEQVLESWQYLGFSLLGFSVVSLLCALWLLSTILRPISELHDTTLRMAEGDLSQRVMNPGQDEIGEVGRAFNQMATQVTQTFDEQRAFASNAAHELRTPLTTIRLRAEGLQSGTLDEETSHQYIAEIDSETNHMSGLIDDLFLLSQLDSERLAVGQEMIDASRLTRRIYNELSPRAEQRSITVTLNEPPDMLPPVQTTLSHLHMVIRNLLENAIKYTPEQGDVTVSLAEHLVEGERFLRIEVSDTGQGIAEEDLHRITQRFYRDARARARQKTQGSGLGLALVDSIIALYRGTLQITSAGPNLGTKAVVLWPFQQE